MSIVDLIQASRNARPSRFNDYSATGGVGPQQARATSRDRSSEDITDLGLRDKQRLEKINEGFAKSGLFTNEIPPRFGGSIPSPRQSYEMPMPRQLPTNPIMPDIEALLRAYMRQMQGGE